MKLHLPLRLLSALLAVLSLYPVRGATVSVSGSSITLDPQEYADGIQITAEANGKVTMNSTATIVRGAAIINMSGGSLFTMERGTLGSGSDSSVVMNMTGSVFNMGGSGMSPMVGTGRGASVNIALSGSSTFAMSSGTLASGGANLTLDVTNSVFELKNSTISNSYTLTTGADGNSSFVHTAAVINVNEGGQFNINGYIGYAGGSAEMHVNQGGVITQTGGIVGFARGAEGGRIEVLVHDGGRYSFKGGNIAVSNAKARITVESGGIFELGSGWSVDSSGKTTQTKGRISGGVGSASTYADIIVKSGATFNMTDGGIATEVTAYTPEAQILISGAFNQSGGDISTQKGRALVVVQEGGAYTMSGGAIGRDGGSAVLDICRGGSFTMRGNASITGNVEIAMGYTPEFTWNNRGSESLWGAPAEPDAQAESGNIDFVQEGGVIDGSVSIRIEGADASYTQSGGEITGSADISLSDGAHFTLSGWGEISGNASVSLGSGADFSMSGGVISENVSLELNGVDFTQTGGDITGNVSITLIGGSFSLSNGSLSTAGNLLLSDGASFVQEQGSSISNSKFSLRGNGSSFSILQGNITDSTFTLASGTSFSMSGGSLSGALSAAGAKLSQSGGLMQADITLTDGADMAQSSNGAICGHISIDASTWAQEDNAGIAHGSRIDITNKGSLTQHSGSIDASITVSGGSSFRQGGLVSGDVLVSGNGSLWEQTGGNITDGSTLSVEEGASLVQSSGVMDAEIRLSGGSTFTQSGSVIGSVQVQSSTMTQQEGSVQGDVRLSSGSKLLQEGGQINGAVEASASSVNQKSSSISGAVTLSDGATLTQNKSSIGGLTASHSSITQQKSSINGAVTLSEQSELTQSEDSSITGEVSLISGASMTQQGDIYGSVSATDASLSQNGGRISGSVELSKNAELTQTGGGHIGGNVTADEAQLSQTDSTIAGDVILRNGSALTQSASAIGGNVSLDASTLTQTAGSIEGSVQMTHNSILTQDGDIGGSVSVASGSIFTRKSGAVGGNISVDDASATLGDTNVNGDVTVTNHADYQQGKGSIAGKVEVTDSIFIHGQGDIGGSITATNSLLMHESGDIQGEVNLTASNLTGSSCCITGDIRLNQSSFFTMTNADITGNLVANGASSFTQGSGTITGNVELANTVFSMEQGNITGDVLVLDNSVFGLQSGNISGRVSVNNSTFTYSGAISDSVEVSYHSLFTQLDGGTIAGDVSVLSAYFTQQGAINGNVTITVDSIFTMSASAEGIYGSVSVDGSRFIQEGGHVQDISFRNAAYFELNGGEILGAIDLSDSSILTQAGGHVKADISLSGSSLNQTGGQIGSVSITLEDSTLTRSGGTIQAEVTMNGSDSQYDMGGTETGGSILLHGGNLAQADKFSGSLLIDTDATYNQSIDLGGAKADRVSAIATRTTSAVMNNVGDGVLTFRGSGNTMLVGTETSNSISDGSHCLINFSDAAAGSIDFEEDASLTLNFSVDVLKEAKENNSHAVEIWLTNGSLKNAPSGTDELAAWLTRHFVVGSGLLGDSSDTSYGWQSAQGGKITLHVNTDGIWISSLDGDVDRQSAWELFNRHNMVIVDEDMHLTQQEGNQIRLNQLSSGGDYSGNLTIETTQHSTKIILNNQESVTGSGNGDTVFHGQLFITGAAADSSRVSKQGAGALSVGGITGAASLQLEEGTLAITGTGSSVGSLAMSTGATLELKGDLLLTGVSDLSAGSMIGGGELIQQGGQLTLGENVVVQVNLTLDSAAVIERAGKVEGSISLRGDDTAFTHTDATDITGDVMLGGDNSSFKHLEQGEIGGAVTLAGANSSLTHGEGGIGGNVELTGAGSSYTHRDGDINGSVTLSGANASFTHGEGSIAGDVTLEGSGSSYEHGDGDIAGSVILSGTESRFRHGNGSIGGDVLMSGESSSFEMSFASIGGSISLSGAACAFTQTGDILGAVELIGNGARFIGQSGSIGGDVALRGDGSIFSQGGDIAGSVTLTGKNAEFTGNGSTISGSVELTGEESKFSGNHSSVTGDVTLSGKNAQFSDSAVAGNVTLSASNTRFSQSGVISGSVSLSGDESALKGDGSGMGELSLSGAHAAVTEAGAINGNALLTGEAASVSGAGAVSGNVILSGSGSSFESNGLVDGDVTLAGASSHFSSQGMTGGMLITGHKAQAEVAGDVGGSIRIEADEAQLTQSGHVQGEGVSISGTHVVYRQAGDVAGELTISGAGTDYSQSGAVSGDVTISGADALYRQQGKVQGRIRIIAEGVLYTMSAGSAANDILLNGAGSVLDLSEADVLSGSIDLQAGELAHAGAYDGSGVLINTSEAQHGALKLGGLKADKISSVDTGIGISLSGLAGGSALTFTGMNTMYASMSSVSFGSNTADSAMIQFDGEGTVAFAEGGQLRLRFEREVCREFGSGMLEVWLTNGSISGMPEESLIAWLHEHILLATGSGMEFALGHGDFSGANEGWLTISASTSDIWQTTDQTSLVKDPGAFGSFSKVDIDADTTLDVEASTDSRAIIRQIEGDHKFTIRNSGSGNLLVEFHNEDVLGYYGDTSFYGDIEAESTGSGAVSIEKTGNAALSLEGHLQTPGHVSVKESKLILNQTGNAIGSLSLGDTAADGAATFGDLVVNGAVTLTGTSDLSSDSGSISGTGLLDIAGSVILGKSVSLSGVHVMLQKDATLHINGVRGSSISGLSGSGTLNLGAEGDLSITGSGEFSGTLTGSGQLATTGKGTELKLSGKGHENYDLMIGVNTSVTLSEAVATASSARTAERSIAWRSITNAGTLTIHSADGTTALTTTGDITLAAGSTTHIMVNLSDAGSAVMESTGGSVILESGSGIQLSLIGKTTGENMSIELIRGADGIRDEMGELLADGTELPNISFSEAIFDLIYKEVCVVVDEDSHSVVLQATKRDEVTENDDTMTDVARTRNAHAGFDMLLAAIQVADREENATLFSAGNAIAEMIRNGQNAEASRALAAVAGSSVPALGAAQQDALREQLLRMRDHVATSGNLLYTAGHAKRPEVHAGIEAVSSFSKLSASGDESGYKLSSWGGTVSIDANLKSPVNVGLALTALYGDLDAEAADSATGSLDSYYVSLFMRGAIGKWSHALVFTLGMNSAELNRSVNYGSGSYTTHGSTDGTAFGAHYELAYDILLNEQKSHILQPFMSISALSSTMKGYTETGADGAGLCVDDQSRTSISLALGARWAAMVSPSVFGRTALAELRLNIAQDLGDTSGEANVALLADPGTQRTIYGAKVGSTALQMGAGLTVPVSNMTHIYLNAGGDLRSGASAWNISAGMRLSF